jgi:pimeloyl-ACP methyl ester carboxylesterase
MPSSGIVIATNTTFRARAFRAGASDSDVATATYNRSPRVVLLLHGFNSDPTTWNDFMTDDEWGLDHFTWSTHAPTIYAGDVENKELAKPDRKGVFYYRVRFGSKDKVPGRTGLEGRVSTGTNGDSGDFTTFENLGVEVHEAVSRVLLLHTDARVVLMGHSRGGIAARAFLQKPVSSPAKQSIAALLTTGTPHSGTHLTRIYGHLAANARTNLAATTNDWKVADIILEKREIDVRKPTIDDLAQGSVAISNLVAGVSNLPTSLKYGTLCYDGAPLGKLKSVLSWEFNVFNGSRALNVPPLTGLARTNILNGKQMSSLTGDGIVHASSQTFKDGNRIKPRVTTNNSGKVLHIDETGEDADLWAMLENLVNWWK